VQLLNQALFNGRHQCDSEAEQHDEDECGQWTVVAAGVTVELTVGHEVLHRVLVLGRLQLRASGA